MVRYLVLFQFPEQGIKHISESASRAEGFQKAAQKAGATVKDIYWIVGRYDGSLVLEATDETAAMALLTKLGSQGNVRTTTLRAFDRSEMESIVGKMK